MSVAAPDTRRFVLDVLRQETADRCWSEQVGPALTQRDTAQLLGKSEQAVSKDRGLLRVRLRSGRVAYPVIQFSGRGVVPGVAEVCAALRDVVEPLTVASWLTARNRSIGDQRPIDALRAGNIDPVVTLSRQLAGTLG